MENCQYLLKKLSEEQKDRETFRTKVHLRLSNYGIAALAIQSTTLSVLEDYVRRDLEMAEEADSLLGIESMLNDIQDQLLEMGHPEALVFPFSCDQQEYGAPNPKFLPYRKALQVLLVAAHKDLPKYLNLSPELDAVLKEYFDKGVI